MLSKPANGRTYEQRMQYNESKVCACAMFLTAIKNNSTVKYNTRLSELSFNDALRVTYVELNSYSSMKVYT